MKFCSHCGKELLDEAMICPNCGCQVSSSEPDVSNTGLNIVSFLLPFVGLILYIIYHEKKPIKAKAIGKWALIGLAVGIIGAILQYVAVLIAFI